MCEKQKQNIQISHVQNLDARREVVSQILQIEKTLNNINLEFYCVNFDFKKFSICVNQQKNLLKKVENKVANNDFYPTYLNKLNGKIQELTIFADKLVVTLNKINDTHIKNLTLIKNLDKIKEQIKIVCNLFINININKLNSEQLDTIIKSKNVEFIAIDKKIRDLFNEYNGILKCTVTCNQIKECINFELINIKNKFGIIVNLRNNLLGIYRKMCFDEHIKKSKTFSNLSKEQLTQLSSKLWIPNKVLNKCDKTKSDYKSANSFVSKIKSNSWFKLDKVSNIINYDNNKNDKLSLEYKNIIGWKNNYCMECNVYKNCINEELLEKQHIGFIKHPELGSILKIENKIKDVKNKTNKITKVNTKPKTTTKFDESKKACKYIITTIYDNVKYARHCGNLCENQKDFCKNHSTIKNDNEYKTFAENLCQHIITQKSGGKNGNEIVDRKGMKCNDFTFGSFNKAYCKIHSKSHKDDKILDKNTELRTFKVRIYPDKKQRDVVESFFGSSRKTYNLCVQNNVFDVMTESEARKKYVTDVDKTCPDLKFLKNIPKDVRSFEISEYFKNIQNSKDMYEEKIKKECWKKEHFHKYEKKEIKKPEFNYKMKNDNQSINISKDAVNIIKDEYDNVLHNKIIIYGNSFGKNGIKIKTRKLKKDNKLSKIFETGITHDIKIIKTMIKCYSG